MVKVTSDNFVWHDVTEKFRESETEALQIWMSFDVYVLRDDESDRQIENLNELKEWFGCLLLGQDIRICVPVGYLPDHVARSERNRGRERSYLKKIAYWRGKGDYKRAEYFTKRQIEKDGPITAEQEQEIGQEFLRLIEKSKRA